MQRDEQVEDARVAIERARRAIDAIDDELLALLERRATLALEIGREKRRAGVPIRDEAREARILARLQERSGGPLGGHALAPIFEPIFELMRRIEEQETRP